MNYYVSVCIQSKQKKLNWYGSLWTNLSFLDFELLFKIEFNWCCVILLYFSFASLSFYFIDKLKSPIQVEMVKENIN